MAIHNDLGHWGESIAADYLQHKGYTILERNWQSGHRDIDIIAQDGQTVVFVEVKTRRNRTFADPEQAIGYQKLYNLRMAANHYIKFRRINHEVRFDVITIVGTPNTGPTIEHIEDFQW